MAYFDSVPKTCKYVRQSEQYYQNNDMINQLLAKAVNHMLIEKCHTLHGERHVQFDLTKLCEEGPIPAADNGWSKHADT